MAFIFLCIINVKEEAFFLPASAGLHVDLFFLSSQSCQKWPMQQYEQLKIGVHWDRRLKIPNLKSKSALKVVLRP